MIMAERIFLSNKKFEYDSAINLSDTVIEGGAYRRVRLNKRFNNNEIYFILYLNCSRKNSLLKLFKPLSDSLGCTIVRDDTFIQNRLFMKIELQFVSNEI
jgi:hypothetical protein